MKKVFLTGGTGLVGRDIAKQLVAEGFKLYLLTRSAPQKHPNIEWIVGDMHSIANDFFDRLPEVDIVVHAGAAVNIPDNMDQFTIYRCVNMEFTERLFRWCSSLENKPVVIYISSLSFLQKPLLSMITETHPIAPMSLYSISKYWGERALFHYSFSATRYRAISVRISSPIVSQYNLLHDTVVKKWVECAINKHNITIFGQGGRTQDFVSTEDVAQALVRAIHETKVEGIYNIASGNAISMCELAGIIVAKMGGTIIYTGCDPNENDRWNISIEKAKTDMGYSPQYTSAGIINRLLDLLI